LGSSEKASPSELFRGNSSPTSALPFYNHPLCLAPFQPIAEDREYPVSSIVRWTCRIKSPLSPAMAIDMFFGLRLTA